MRIQHLLGGGRLRQYLGHRRAAAALACDAGRFLVYDGESWSAPQAVDGVVID